MKPLSLYEHGVLRPRRDDEDEAHFGDAWERVVPARWYDRLRRYDLARGEEKQVFRWEHGRARARQWVGVIQRDDITLELLPKVEREDGDTDERVRSNLLWFLTLSGSVPNRARDMARLHTRSATLLDALSDLFAQRLLDELLQGPARAYVTREENLRRFKGKLVVPAQIARNAAHRERFVCRFDELSEDTDLNRVLRCACGVLVRRARRPATQEALMRCLEELDAVSVIPVQVARRVAARVVVDRQSERYLDVFTFARLVLDDESPEPQAGATGTFSLLFDMNVVFEAFIAGFLRRHVVPTLDGWNLAAQGRGDRRHLLAQDGVERAAGMILLKPDLLLVGPEGRRVVIDTKWKTVHPRGASNRKRPPDADFYQLHAYAHRYGGDLNVLLHPQSREPVRERYRALDHEGSRGRAIQVHTVDLHRNFSEIAARDALRDELISLLQNEGAKA